MGTYTAYFRLSTRIIIAIALFLGGVAFGQYADTFLPGAPKSYRDVTDLTQGYQFIDPLLFCSDHEMTGQTASFSQKLQDQLTSVINDAKKIRRRVRCEHALS